jgi:hypothetical protein
MDEKASGNLLPLFLSGEGPSLWTGTGRQILDCYFLLSIPFLFNYLFSWVTYHWVYRKQAGRRVPPELPAILPFLGNTIPFLWDSASFVTKATYEHQSILY